MNSLQEECLSQITENIDIYSAWYAKSKGTPYAIQFEFLRRAYSDTLFSKLLGDFEEEHLDLLISPYLKHLDIRHVDKKLIRGIADRLKANGSGIETVKARFSKLLYEQLVPSLSHLLEIEIGGFRNTRVSSIYGIYTSEMIMSLGRHCPLLRILKLRDDEDGYSAGQCILSEGLELCPKLCEAVSYLLDRCSFLEILENINTVEILYEKHKLDLQKNALGKCKKYSLTKLSFLDGVNYPLLDAYKICFRLCPKVTCIELHWVDSKQLVRCPDFLALCDAKILFGTATIGDMNHFLNIRGSKLVNLELYHPYIAVQTLIKCCPELKHLTLSSVAKFKPVKPEDFSISVTGLPKLKSFFIDQTGFSQKKSREAYKLIISASKNLEKVHFRSMMGFTEEFCDILFELGFHRVRELNVGRTDIPLSFLIKLLTQGKLQNLDVWHCACVNSDQARNTLYGLKRQDQIVSVTCFNDRDEVKFGWYPRDEWDFRDLRFYPGSDYDSDVDGGLDSFYDSDFDFHDSDFDYDSDCDSDFDYDSDIDLEEYINIANFIELLYCS